MAGMDQDDELLSIGEIARASGLSISALRFYDRQRVLPPAEVDPATGYRWYAQFQLADAMLMARLRRIGLPLPEISTILSRADPDLTRAVLQDHIGNLESGLTTARREVNLLSRQIGVEAPPATVASQDFRATLSGADLVAGMRTVRHAVGDDLDLPAIHGIYLVAVSRGLRLSATDRHRAAFAEVPAESTGRLRALLATTDADRLLDLELNSHQVQVCIGAGHLRLFDPDGHAVFDAQLLDAAFPDLSHAIPAVRGSVIISAEGLFELLQEHKDTEVWSLCRAADTLRLAPDVLSGDSPDTVYVDRAYLKDALVGLTGGERHGQLRFDFDGPAEPLAIRRADDLGTFAVVLPVIPGRTL